MAYKWIAKAVVQKVISFMPYREKLNYLFQRYVTHGVELNDVYFGYKIQAASDHVKYMRKYAPEGILCNQAVLELGTGWYPVIPISMYLSGALSVTSIDIRQWMNKKSILTCIDKFIEWRTLGKLDNYLKVINEERWNTLIQISDRRGELTEEQILDILRFRTLVTDARNTGLPARSFDLICSNNTFEHIYPVVLENILREFKRLLKPGGLMSHHIDMSDHFAHFDTSITIYNFLRFSSRRWKTIDNRIQPQNRLRFIDFKEMYKNLGIPVTEEVIWEGSREQLSLLKLAPEFNRYTREELAVSHAYLVSKFPD